jgi:hypothetical protein
MFIKIKTRTFLTIFSFVILIVASIAIPTCKNPISNELLDNDNRLSDTQNGDTRLIVAIHDTPFKKDDKTVERLNITISRMDIIDSDGKHITILNEERSMDILAISRNDPVILSDVSVEPGVYQELRLVLKDNSTIQVDGDIFDIKIPSGGQSGLKLKGPFMIPKGKLFRLTVDFVASESIIHNKGQGYMLKPLLKISNTSEIIGIFRGNLAISSNLGVCETLFQMYTDNTARLRISDYPHYTLYTNYVYNSSAKELRLTNLNLDAPGLRRRALKEVIKKLPNEIVLPVKQWSVDSIIAIDHSGVTCNLYRVDEFNFSEGVSFSEFTLNIDYPDSSKIGKDVFTEIKFIDTGMPPLTFLHTFEGSRITQIVPVKNFFIQGSSTRIQITSYLFDNSSNLNLEPGLFGGFFVPMMMAGSHFTESTSSKWQSEKNIYTLQRDSGQTFSVAFPNRLNIRVDHQNFNKNNPIIKWEKYPEANNGYVVLVIAYNKKGNMLNTPLQLLYHTYTDNTSITVPADYVRFIEYKNSKGEVMPPNVKKGDILISEIFVLDGTDKLDTANYIGALYMESLITEIF